MPTATAPYNFVPLPKVVVPAPLEAAEGADAKEKYIAYLSETDALLSGVIDLQIETKTPCFVGLNDESEAFFAVPGEAPRIPGSTIRGMVKNLLKIVTCGAMRPSGRKSLDSDEIEGDGDFFDHLLYFREMASKQELGIKAVYDKEMKQGSDSRHGTTKAKAGFLIRCKNEEGLPDNSYFICKTIASEVPEGKVDRAEKQRIVDIIREYEGKKDGSCVQWDGVPGAPEGVACFTGPMNTGNKKGKWHYTVHQIPSDWNDCIPVPDKVIMAYKDDETRRGVNLLDEKDEKMGMFAKEAARFTNRNDVNFVVPCFYVADKEGVRHFGFGRYYRIPYQKSIADHIPDVVADVNHKLTDFADAMFGRKEDWGSRLFFEDCVCETEHVVPFNAQYTRVLSSPKPTAFQLYLEQGGAGLRHWNDEQTASPIRGYKLYWHQKNNPQGWIIDDEANALEDAKKIAPIAAHTQFCGHIRFERLKAEELGALLQVFHLSTQGENICYKLGRGKSIGMGSVSIRTKLKLIGRDAYTQLFSESGAWNEGEKDSPAEAYLQAFRTYIEEFLSKKGLLEKYKESMADLRTILDWNHTELDGWEDATRMMSFNDPAGPFKNRFILQEPREVVADAENNT